MTSPTSSSSSLSTSVAANLAAVRATIVQHGRSLESVTIVAVSKNHDVDVVRAGYEAGLRVFGENYVHELVAKADATRDLADLQWQFLGALQSRKIDTVCQWADEVLSVSREKEVAALAHHGAEAPRVFVQVDYADSPGRNGVAPSAASALIASCRRQGLDVRGLMTVAPPHRREAERAFRLLSELAHREGVAELSMGMSDDYDLALAYGSTQVRLGRTLFGPRTPVSGLI